MHRLLCLAIFASHAPAAVRSIEIAERTPIDAGYERIAGRVHFGLNPKLPANRIVRDLEFAPLNAASEAECAADFYILQPQDAAKGNGTILFEVSNRGGKGMLSRFDFARGPSDFGDLWVLQQGYTLVWLGWEWDIPASNRAALHFTAPHFRADALPAAGLVRSEFTPEKSATVMTLGDRAQDAIPVSKALALFVRQGTDAAPKQVPSASWALGADGRSVEMRSGFEAGMLYEFVYEGKDPVIAGAGLAAMRDWISFLKFGGEIPGWNGRQTSLKRAIGFGISQSGRLLREFLYDGFNADESGRQVFDGVWADVAGAGRGSFNFRYAQPSRDGWPYLNAFYPTDLFPFTDTDETDPVTHQSGSLLARARAANVTPKIFFTNDSSEYWGRAASLIHITADGKRDAALSPGTRIYFNAAVQHMPRSVDTAGNVYVADVPNARVREVTASGIIVTVAGNGIVGYNGDGGPATAAQLALGYRSGVAVDAAGNLYIADSGNQRVRQVLPSGPITTIAGNGGLGAPGSNVGATATTMSFPAGLAFDKSGNLYITDYGVVQKLSPGGSLTTIAGNGVCCGFSGDGGPALQAQVNASAVAVDNVGNLFVVDAPSQRIRQVTPGGTVNTVAGNGVLNNSTGDGGPAVSARFSAAGALAADTRGNLFVIDGNLVRKIAPTGIVTTIAGGGTGGLGDGGPATSATLSLIGCNSLCSGIAVDGAGNVFLADVGNNRVRKVSPAGTITTVAGGGSDASGRSGPALTAALAPNSVALDAAGNLYIAEVYDGNNGFSRIRKVTPDGTLTVIAGGGTAYPGNNGPATAAQLGYVFGIAVDGAGSLYLTEGVDIRKVSPSGQLTLVIGDGNQPPQDDGPTLNVALNNADSVAVDGAGNIFFTDYNRVMKISSDGLLHIVGGSGTYGYYTTNGEPAGQAPLGFLSNLTMDSSGNVYASDWYNNVVHILQPASQPVFISSLVNAASQLSGSITPGQIVVLYGNGIGPPNLSVNNPRNGSFGALGDTTVTIGGIPAPVLYASEAQTAVVAPYGITGASQQVVVTESGQTTNPFTVPSAAAAPALFTANQTGSGQAAAINVTGSQPNSALNPVKIGDYLSLFATGEGQTAPAGVDGQVAGATPPQPSLPVSVTVDGLPAAVQYAGGVPGQVEGMLQVNVHIPSGVHPGGYVPVVLTVGDAHSAPPVWIAVVGN